MMFWEKLLRRDDCSRSGRGRARFSNAFRNSATCFVAAEGEPSKYDLLIKKIKISSPRYCYEGITLALRIQRVGDQILMHT
jgi:hypothetical protein